MAHVTEQQAITTTHIWFSSEKHEGEDGTTYTVQVKHEETKTEIKITVREVPDPPSEEQVQAAADRLAEQGLEPEVIERVLVDMIESGALTGSNGDVLDGDWTNFTGGAVAPNPANLVAEAAASAPPPPAGDLDGTTDVTQAAEAHFDDWDADADGVLTEDELLEAIADPAYTGEDAAALVALYRRYDEVKGASNDQVFGETGISVNDLLVVEAAAANGDDFARLGVYFDAAKDRADNASAVLFGAGGPDPYAVQQGGFADCTFHAALSALALQRPDDITNMIQANADGSFTVTFPGEDPVNVPPLTDGQLGIGGTAGANGQWVTVLEIAYREVTNNREGALTGAGIRTLTGNGTIPWLPGLDSPDSILASIDAALDADGVVTVSNNFGSENLPEWHIYSVLDYDTANGTITIRNPWGRGELEDANGAPIDGTDDGVFTVTEEEFLELFESVSVENVD